jgi:hypothetical protein
LPIVRTVVSSAPQRASRCLALLVGERNSGDPFGLGDHFGRHLPGFLGLSCKSPMKDSRADTQTGQRAQGGATIEECSCGNHVRKHERPHGWRAAGAIRPRAPGVIVVCLADFKPTTRR